MATRYRIVWRQLKKEYRKAGEGPDEMHERFADTKDEADRIVEQAYRAPGLTIEPHCQEVRQR